MVDVINKLHPDPEVRQRSDGSWCWFVDNQLHRDDGPARVYPNGDSEWWLNGKVHRADGPAMVFCSGYRGWYFEGVHYTFDDWLKQTPISDEEKVMLKLIYG